MKWLEVVWRVSVIARSVLIVGLLIIYPIDLLLRRPQAPDKVIFVGSKTGVLTGNVPKSRSTGSTPSPQKVQERQPQEEIDP